MHYYKKNIGDYYKKASRLTMLQHGAYNLLIDACYDRERFPTKNEAIEWSWASSKDEIEAVEFILKRFFVFENNVYLQKRIEDELDNYHKNSATNKRIAIERETKRKEISRNREENNTNRKQTVDSTCTDLHEAPPNQEPLTKNQEPLNTCKVCKCIPCECDQVPVKANNCPVNKIIELWNNTTNLSKVQHKSDAIRKGISSRWREDKAFQTIEFWEKLFIYVQDNDFLAGRSTDWKVSLQWLVGPKNFSKVLNNDYERQGRLV